MKPFSYLLILLALVSPAWGLDVIYPIGSRVGLAPPPGLTVSQSFSGFEDRSNRVALVIATLPAAAYREIEQSATSEVLQKQGMTIEAREDITHPLGKGFLVRGRLEIENQPVHKWILILSADDLTALVTIQVPVAAQSHYPDDAIRTALASLAVRDSIPAEERLSLLPFRVSELAGFKVGGVMAGRAVMLTDGAPQPSGPTLDTHIMIAVGPGGPTQASDRGRFAREVFEVPNLKDVKITSSEALRIGGQQGHQIMASGRDSATGEEVKVVQWLRFGGGGDLHLLGAARSEGWMEAEGPFRRVRDGIELR
jgi:hypothetical protein